MGRFYPSDERNNRNGERPQQPPRLIVGMESPAGRSSSASCSPAAISSPLHQPGVILKKKAQVEKENPSNGKCASSSLSQLRGSPHSLWGFVACKRRFTPHRLKSPCGNSIFEWASG